jgi:MtfA peptidase
LGFLTARRRRRILERHPIPDDLWRAVVGSRGVFAGLTAEEIDLLRELATVFVAEKQWEAPYGGEVDPAVRAEIAALAALPVLGLGSSWYDNWRTVVVVPRPHAREYVEHHESGLVDEFHESDAGESWDDGPVVLSLRDVAGSRRGRGDNVVIHEAAHRIDMTDGEVNGRPALHLGMDPGEWLTVCGAAFDDLRAKIERGRRTRIDPYATESDAEFFAVMSETFFERPRLLRAGYPRLYELFAQFYRQDPADRADRTRRGSVRGQPRRRRPRSA